MFSAASPARPYWGLRDYGTAKWEGGDEGCEHTIGSGDNDNLKPYVTRPERDGTKRQHCQLCGAIRIDSQLGLEPTPEAYVDNLVAVFREIRRVLRDDGTVWLNLGDSYVGTGNKGEYKDPKYADGRNGQAVALNNKVTGLKSKDLVGIPWRVAFALQADGWWLRQDIIWAKANPMPESVTDRCTRSHEYVFLLTKSARYYFNNEAIKEPAVTCESRPPGIVRDRLYNYDSKQKVLGRSGNKERKSSLERGCPADHVDGSVPWEGSTRNKRDVWFITAQPFKDAHFAVMPEKLVEPCILAGSRPGDTVLDPFSGAGTVGLVATKLGRSYIGIELNAEYIEMTERRLAQVQPTLELM